MPRRPRFDAPGVVHHVIQRGVERRPTFLDDSDRLDFLRRLDKILAEEDARCLAWVLMPNHYHLVLQTVARPIWKAMHRIGTGYSMRFNHRYERVGHLVQNRFRSRIARDEDDVKGLIRYVHRNPLRARQVASLEQLERHPWSGHGALVGRQPARRFHATHAALAYFGESPAAARDALASWMLDADEYESSVEAAALGAASGLAPHERFLRARDLLCTRHGVAIADLEAGSREASVTRVRQALSALGVHELGLPARGIAAALGASTSGVSKAARSKVDRAAATASRREVQS